MPRKFDSSLRPCLTLLTTLARSSNLPSYVRSRTTPRAWWVASERNTSNFSPAVAAAVTAEEAAAASRPWGGGASDTKRTVLQPTHTPPHRPSLSLSPTPCLCRRRRRRRLQRTAMMGPLSETPHKETRTNNNKETTTKRQRQDDLLRPVGQRRDGTIDGVNVCRYNGGLEEFPV